MTRGAVSPPIPATISRTRFPLGPMISDEGDLSNTPDEAEGQISFS